MRDSHIHGLLGVLAETQADELDCEHFLEFMAQYAELRAAGQPVPDALAGVVAHERLCANCREECAALIESIQTEG
jgi:hypothetical protein